MNLKKRKHFAAKKEGSFLMSFFLSYCFSYQTRKDLVLVKFCYNAAVQRFFKTFRKSAGKRLWKRTFLEKLFSLPNTFLWLLSKTHSEHIPLNDNIVWYKYSRVIKDLSKKGSFFLLNTPKYLGARFFILSTRKLYVFSEMYSSQKKSVKLKRFLCKDKFSQNFLKSLV